MESPFFATNHEGRHFEIREIKCRIMAELRNRDEEAVVGEVLLRHAAESKEQHSENVTDADPSPTIQYGSVTFELLQRYELARAINEAYGPQSIEDILAVERIRISPAYRCRGVGTRVLRAIVATLEPECRLIVLKPFPLDWHEIDFENSEWGRIKEDRWLEQGTARLQRFYQRLGFCPLSKGFMSYRAKGGARLIGPALETAAWRP